METAVAVGAYEAYRFQIEQLIELAAWPDGRIKAFTGVDLAAAKHSRAARTVLATIVLYPEPDLTRHIVGLESGRWTGPEIIDRIFSAHYRYGSTLIVENNAAQKFIVDFTRERGQIPVIPFTTGKQKIHPELGIDAMAAEFAAGKWLIPCQGDYPDPEIEAFIEEILSYDPMGHSGDRLMAFWLARQGVLIEEARLRPSFLTARAF